MNFTTIKSSHHAERTPTDPKTERAFHLLKFNGTEKDKEPPVFDTQAASLITRREPIPRVEPTPEELKAINEARRPGESQDQYNMRTRLKHKKRVEEYKWVVEGNCKQKKTRYEGMEDLTQPSRYMIVFPAEEGRYKVALLDQWIDLRKYVDTSKYKQELQDAALRKHLQKSSMRWNEDAEESKLEMEFLNDKEFGQLVSKSQDAAAMAGGGSSSWIKGREDMQRNRTYRMTGMFGKEDKNKSSKDDEVDDDENQAEEAVDHEHSLAIDRMALDGDEFAQEDYEFDDDDDGAQEDLGNETLAGVETGYEIVEQDEEGGDAMEGEEDDDVRSGSESEDPGSPLPTSVLPLTRNPILAASKPKDVKPVVPLVRTKSLEEEVTEFYIETILAMGGKLSKDQFRDLTMRAKQRFSSQIDENTKSVFPKVVKMLLEIKKSDLDGVLYVLKPEFYTA